MGFNSAFKGLSVTYYSVILKMVLFISEITVNEAVRSGPILVQSAVLRNPYVLNPMTKSPVIRGLCLKHRSTMRMNLSRLTLNLRIC